MVFFSQLSQADFLTVKSESKQEKIFSSSPKVSNLSCEYDISNYLHFVTLFFKLLQLISLKNQNNFRQIASREVISEISSQPR